MPRDLFGQTNRPFDGVGGRSRLTVPVSLALHVAAVAALVVAPLLATDSLPALHTSLTVSMVTPVVPAPPPLRRAAPPTEAAPPANPDAASIEVPDGVTKEPDWQRDEIFAANDGPGIVDGIDSAVALVPPPPPAPPPEVKKPIRVGGEIQPPTKVHHVAPVYPAMAQQARVEGIVIISTTIGVDGSVTDATVLSAKPLLAEAAVEAVRQWRFTPTRLNGEPVPVMMTVTVAFRLQ